MILAITKANCVMTSGCDFIFLQMRGQLDREVELRVSLEKSHSSLLTRLEDVELLMEQERAQVYSIPCAIIILYAYISFLLIAAQR